MIILAVLLTLLAIILPAVQMARSSARRATCKNNLKWIGLGLHNYADTYNLVLPPGLVANYAGEAVSVEGPTADHVGCVGWSWQTNLTPFVWSYPIYYRFDFSLSIGEMSRGSADRRQQNNAAVGTDLGYVICPSDDRTPVVPLDHSNGDPPFQVANSVGGLASTSYYGSAGAFEEVVTHPQVMRGTGLPPIYDGGWSNPHMANGIFAVNSSVTLDDFVDGLSLTIGVGEVSGQQDPYASTRSSAFGSIGPNGAVTQDVALSVLRTGEWRINAARSGSVIGAERGFSSEHRGGAQFLFMDGTVHFISNDIHLIPSAALPSNDPRQHAGCDWAPVDLDPEGDQAGRCGTGVYAFRSGPKSLDGSSQDPAIAHMDTNFGLYQRLFSRNDRLRIGEF